MPNTKTALKRTSPECKTNGHDWVRYKKDNGKYAGHKHCWRCGRTKRARRGHGS